jgi:Arp2/3 complex, 34 kD subunit p34-Arc
VDARRQPAIQNAPQVLYTNREPPLELRGLPGLKDSANIGYVTFGIFLLLTHHFQSYFLGIFKDQRQPKRFPKSWSFEITFTIISKPQNLICTLECALELIHC